jgi:thaumarchaeosortase
MNIPLQRKLIYFLIGTVGTAAVNLIRIISLSLFALMITTNVNEWEEFHSVAGEIMFLPWLGIYLASVIYIESKRSQQFLSISQSTTKSATTSANDPLHNGNNTDNAAGL